MAVVLDRLITELGFDTDNTGLDTFKKKVEATKQVASELGRTLVIVGAVASAAFGLAAKSAIDWETAFTGVRKTVTATEQEFAALAFTLREMAKEDVPLPVGELAGLAEQAGQLGIQTGNIENFVKVMAQLGTTTNLSADQGASQLARFANITQMSQGDFDRLGATIVDLGNNFATTEAELVDMALRLAGAGDLAGLTEAQILAIATALRSVGLRAEAGGTAFSRVFVEMQKSVQGSTAELVTFNKVVGGDFANIFTNQGPEKAVLAFVEGLGAMIERGENVHIVLEELGFDNVRIRDALLRAAGAGDLMAEALEVGNAAWTENSALTREAELRYQTMGARIQFAKNKVADLAISVGGSLAPAIVGLVDKLLPMVDLFNRLATSFPWLIQLAALFSVGILGLGGSLLALGLVLNLVTTLTRGYALAKVFAVAVTKTWNTSLLVTRARLLAMSVAQGIATVAQWALNVAMTANPIGVIIVGIGALIAVLASVTYFVYRFTKSWELAAAAMLALFGPAGWVIAAALVLYKFRDQIADFFTGTDWFGIGKNLIGAIIQGMLGGGLIGALGGLLNQARNLLPFSDAKEGPLSDLTASGRSLVDTIAKGMNQAQPLPLADILAPTLPVGPLPVAAAAAPAPGGNTFTITIGSIQITADGGDPTAIASGITDAIAEQVRVAAEEIDSKVRA